MAPKGRDPCLVLERGEEVEREDEGAAEEDGDGGEEGTDEEHHDGGAAQPDEARVPRKVLEGRPESTNAEVTQLFRASGRICIF